MKKKISLRSEPRHPPLCLKQGLIFLKMSVHSGQKGMEVLINLYLEIKSNTLNQINEMPKCVLMSFKAKVVRKRDPIFTFSRQVEHAVVILVHIADVRFNANAISTHIAHLYPGVSSPCAWVVERPSKKRFLPHLEGRLFVRHHAICGCPV